MDLVSNVRRARTSTVCSLNCRHDYFFLFRSTPARHFSSISGLQANTSDSTSCGYVYKLHSMDYFRNFLRTRLLAVKILLFWIGSDRMALLVSLLIASLVNDPMGAVGAGDLTRTLLPLPSAIGLYYAYSLLKSLSGCVSK